MYWHWDWGSIMYAVSALSGLVITIFLVGYGLMDQGPGAGHSPQKAQRQQPEGPMEQMAPAFKKAA